MNIADPPSITRQALLRQSRCPGRRPALPAIKAATVSAQDSPLPDPFALLRLADAWFGLFL